MRLSVLALLALCVVALKLLRMQWQVAGGAAFLLLGLYPITWSFWEVQSWLPPQGLWCFWAGLALYVLQQAVYAFRYPNPLPGLFGFREVQHSILLVATTTHAWVVVKYL
jgi:predicted membrane channel-forming protein YqfA (hemolysin III family)